MKYKVGDRVKLTENFPENNGNLCKGTKGTILRCFLTKQSIPYDYVIFWDIPVTTSSLVNMEFSTKSEHKYRLWCVYKESIELIEENTEEEKKALQLEKVCAKIKYLDKKFEDRKKLKKETLNTTYVPNINDVTLERIAEIVRRYSIHD